MPGGGAFRVPRGWLAEHVALPATRSSRELADALVRVGFEVEQIENGGRGVTGPVVVGQVLSIEQLSEFKKPIRWCQVAVGEHQPRGIVCGAQNFAVGDRVVVALPGAALPGGFEISARQTYGHVSDGMICSERELGLGDDHAGILVLASGEVGADARSTLGLDDDVFHIAVTPDRGYALSIRGLARELATALQLPFTDPVAIDIPPAGDGYPVTVVAADGCDRFSALTVTGLDPAAVTPSWLSRRLRQAGMRPISLAVDVTNYVMIEFGQPLHAFDAATLKGALGVRRAAAGETLRTLDGQERRLHPGDLLVTDDGGPVALAGVMGGERTEVSSATTDLVLEAAHWNPADIAMAVRRHRLPSEAAKRFERGVDPQVASPALARCAQLLARYGAATAGAALTVVGDPPSPRPISARWQRIRALAGMPLTETDIVNRLEQVGCTVRPGDPLVVSPPSWRPDLSDTADLTEEVARLVGYDRIPATLPSPPPGRGLTSQQRLRRDVARAVAAAGLVEVLPSPFMSSQVLDQLGLPAGDPRRRTVELANPLADTEPLLRTTLLPGLLAALARNLGRGNRDLALYSIGVVFLPGPDQPLPPDVGVGAPPTSEQFSALQAALPAQPRHLAAVLAGDVEPKGWWGPGRAAGWADAVELARVIAAAARASLQIAAGQLPPWHPGRCAELRLADRLIGHAGELHPGVVAALQLPPRTVALELDLDAFPSPKPVPAPRLSSYPPALLDIALVVADTVPAAEVEQAVRAGAGPLLESIRLFDVWADPSVLGAGRRSLAYSLRWRAPDRTLTSDEAIGYRNAAVQHAIERVGAQLRA